jgi:hypothetical protein
MFLTKPQETVIVLDETTGSQRVFVLDDEIETLGETYY